MADKNAAVLFVGQHVPRHGTRVSSHFIRVQIRQKFPQIVFGNAFIQHGNMVAQMPPRRFSGYGAFQRLVKCPHRFRSGGIGGDIHELVVYSILRQPEFVDLDNVFLVAFQLDRPYPVSVHVSVKVIVGVNFGAMSKPGPAHTLALHLGIVDDAIILRAIFLAGIVFVLVVVVVVVIIRCF